MKLNPTTTATLNDLESANWFVNVGKPLAVDPLFVDKVIACKSWNQAIEQSSSTKWGNIQIEAGNALSSRVIAAKSERFHVWNDLVDNLKPLAVDLVGRKICSVVAEHKLPNAFRHTVEWDILHLLLEAEYSDIVKPTFFAAQAYWYASGRFPCGWKGRFPQGQLIVY